MNEVKIPTMAELTAEGKQPEVLFWVGCAGSFDQRAQSVSKALVRILNRIGVSFAILGEEELCTGDPARRAGNEFLFQMQAQMNIATLNNYEVKKIVTNCPHCFNTLKNEYSELGGNYEVIHHSDYLQQLINSGRIKLQGGGTFKGKKITYHDSCYLGRANDIYEAPRALLEALDADLAEMKRSRQNGLCCGAGGAQMFKEDEAGKLRINQERSKDIVEIQPDIVAVACPFCNTMLTDALKETDLHERTKVKDLAELLDETLRNNSVV